MTLGEMAKWPHVRGQKTKFLLHVHLYIYAFGRCLSKATYP